MSRALEGISTFDGLTCLFKVWLCIGLGIDQLYGGHKNAYGSMILLIVVMFHNCKHVKRAYGLMYLAICALMSKRLIPAFQLLFINKPR